MSSPALKAPVLAMPEARPMLLIADGHVHFYPCFEPDRFFDGAWRNLAAVAERAGADPHSWQGALLLTESAEHDAFAQFVLGERTGRWCPIPTGEPDTVRLQRADGARLLVVSGFQVVTEEGLEVLAIGTRTRVPDGLPIDMTLARIRQAGVTPVLPWGFGKWSFERGRIVQRLVEEARAGEFALGDNGGRLRRWPRPGLFVEARRHGLWIFPGSDPLPFASQVRRVGSYGFTIHGWRPGTQPGAAIRASLRQPVTVPRPFGQRAGLVELGISQLRMQLRKRVR